MRLKRTLSATLIFVAISLVFLGISLPASQTSASAQTASTIQWSGYTWNVRNGPQQLSTPGPNYWSSSNVWIDQNGWLHLRISKVDGQWCCAEVATQQSFGYGTYTFYTVSRLDNFDQNVVLGLFAYADNSHEVDIEYSKWGSAVNNNGWFTVQPPPITMGYNSQAFNIQMSGTYATSYFTWTPNYVYFESDGGHYAPGTAPSGNVFSSFTSYKQVTPGDEKADINLWLFNGVPPSNGSSAEVVISSFTFTPL